MTPAPLQLLADAFEAEASIIDRLAGMKGKAHCKNSEEYHAAVAMLRRLADKKTDVISSFPVTKPRMHYKMADMLKMTLEELKTLAATNNPSDIKRMAAVHKEEGTTVEVLWPAKVAPKPFVSKSAGAGAGAGAGGGGGGNVKDEGEEGEVGQGEDEEGEDEDEDEEEGEAAGGVSAVPIKGSPQHAQVEQRARARLAECRRHLGLSEDDAGAVGAAAV